MTDKKTEAKKKEVRERRGMLREGAGRVPVRKKVKNDIPTFTNGLKYFFFQMYFTIAIQYLI